MPGPPPRRRRTDHHNERGETSETGRGRQGIRRDRPDAHQDLATVSASAASWNVLPRQQLAIGLAIFALVALVTVAPVLVVVVGACAKNAWYETFVGNAVNRSAIGYSFLLALRAPVAAFIGFLIAWLLIRIRIPGGRFIEFSMWVSF